MVWLPELHAQVAAVDAADADVAAIVCVPVVEVGVWDAVVCGSVVINVVVWVAAVAVFVVEVLVLQKHRRSLPPLSEEGSCAQS